MKILKNSALLFLLSVLPACGQQLVEFPGASATDAGNNGMGNTDARNTDGARIDGAGPGTNLDASTADARSPDVANVDVAMTDARTPDAGTTDARNPDGSIVDGGTADRALIDVLNLDRANLDLPNLDTGLVDAANLDSAPLDAANVDTGNVADVANAMPPTVVSTSPANMAMNVAITTRPTARFSEPMDSNTINMTTFTLQQGLMSIAGTVSYDMLSMTATFTPTSMLALNMTYTATVTTGAKDANGNPLMTNHVWTFTTSACGQAPVVLGAASNFVVLAGSTVTNTGPTSVTGDLGVSPGTAVTGFPPGTVVGAQHAGDPTSAQGVADLTTAYNDAAGRTLCPVTVAGNLGGQTLTPGLYKSTSSLEISSGDLTLDAQGDGNAVFIFQMASTLTTTAGRQVVLSGNAKSTNVFWQVGTSATLGSTSAFQGTIMADQAITLNTGVTLNGRALARIAAVTLDSNTIVKPAP